MKALADTKRSLDVQSAKTSRNQQEIVPTKAKTPAATPTSSQASRLSHKSIVDATNKQAGPLTEAIISMQQLIASVQNDESKGLIPAKVVVNVLTQICDALCTALSIPKFAPIARTNQKVPEPIAISNVLVDDATKSQGSKDDEATPNDTQTAITQMEASPITTTNVPAVTPTKPQEKHQANEVPKGIGRKSVQQPQILGYLSPAQKRQRSPGTTASSPKASPSPPAKKSTTSARIVSPSGKLNVTTKAPENEPMTCIGPSQGALAIPHASENMMP